MIFLIQLWWVGWTVLSVAGCVGGRLLGAGEVR
jgi:hypothetical protein